MTGVRFVRFYPSDWRSGCIGLSMEQEGLYIRICAFIYETERRLPSDPSTAAKFMGVHTNAYTKVHAQLVALGKLVECEDGWTVARVEKELSAVHGAIESADQERGAGRQSDQAERETRPDTLGDTPPDTPPVTTLVTPQDTVGVFPEKVNEIITSSYKPVTNNQNQKNITPLAPQGGRTTAQKRGSRLDPDWELPADWFQWARTNYPAVSVDQIIDQAAQFRDFWIAKPGVQACKLDWEATWRNWCRRGLVVGTIRKPQYTAAYQTQGPEAFSDCYK